MGLGGGVERKEGERGGESYPVVRQRVERARFGYWFWRHVYVATWW